MFRVLLLIVALAAGGAAAWLALGMRTAQTVIVQPGAQAPTQDVLVASANLVLGQALTKDNMRWQDWPESALNVAYIMRSARPDALEALAGSIVRSRIVAGEP